MNWDVLLLQAAINAVIIGLLYLLTAIGFTLVFGVMRVVNFAHGAFYMLGAVLTYMGFTHWGVPIYLAIVLATVLVMLVGVAIDFVVMRRFRRDEIDGLIATVALALVIENVAVYLFGPDAESLDGGIGGALRIGAIILPSNRLVAGLAALLILCGLYLVLYRSKIGRSLRAVVEDYDIARIQGVRSHYYYPIGFGIGVGLAAVGGALMTSMYPVSPFVGDAILLKAFIIVVLGGLGSMSGTVAASMVIGFVESFGVLFFDSNTVDIAIYALVTVMLIVRPRGLLGRGAI